MRPITSRKPWKCDHCREEQPQGSIKHQTRTGRRVPILPSKESGWRTYTVLVDGEWEFCANCYQRHYRTENR